MGEQETKDWSLLMIEIITNMQQPNNQPAPVQNRNGMTVDTKRNYFNDVARHLGTIVQQDGVKNFPLLVLCTLIVVLEVNEYDRMKNLYIRTPLLKRMLLVLQLLQISMRKANMSESDIKQCVAPLCEVCGKVSLLG